MKLHSGDTNDTRYVLLENWTQNIFRRKAPGLVMCFHGKLAPRALTPLLFVGAPVRADAGFLEVVGY